MRLRLASVGLAAIVLGGAAPASAHGGYGGVGSLVSVSLEVDGRIAPLYPAPDGSGRYYLEAWRGARYAVRLVNRTGERLGVRLTVDGLNAISGERSPAWPRRAPGRMYVLSPWDETLVQGWRTSLEDVRRFTFVDEQRSYAARSGKAGGRLGWIEVEVYREQRPVARAWPYWPPYPPERPYEDEPRAESEGDSKMKRERDSAARDGMAERPLPPATAAPSYPGTGWGPRADDPVRIVSFDPEAAPSERVTLRYEYAPTLRALGILPRTWWTRDRLRERERGEGFARPPIY